MTQSIKWKLIPSLFLPFLAGGIGSFFTVEAVEQWYPTLVKPFFTPPSWVFGPVWTTMYLCMGIAFYLVLRTGWEQQTVRKATYWFGSQLALNALWPIAFFGAKSPLLGMIVILPLLAAIAETTRQFWRLSQTAGWLLVPYLLWTSYATAMNLGILLLN